MEIEADNILQLGCEIRIVADLEAFNAMWLQSVGVPDATHTGLADAGHSIVTIDPGLKYCYAVPRLCAFFLAQRRETDAFLLGRINS